MGEGPPRTKFAARSVQNSRVREGSTKGPRRVQTTPGCRLAKFVGIICSAAKFVGVICSAACCTWSKLEWNCLSLKGLEDVGVRRGVQGGSGYPLNHSGQAPVAMLNWANCMGYHGVLCKASIPSKGRLCNIGARFQYFYSQ